MTKKTIRIAVIGAGHMGRLHIKTCLLQPQCILTTIVDPNPAICKSNVPNCEFLHDIKFLSKSTVDAAIIATPEDTHAQIAIPLLECGIHCLVEKPLSLNLQEMKQMQKSARIGSAVLTVGHCERFNDALKEVKKYKKNSMILVKRTSICLNRKKNSDVIYDLLVHDIDWMVKTFQSKPKKIEVNNFSIQNNQISQLDCQFQFRNNVKVSVYVDHLSQSNERFIFLKNKYSQKKIDLKKINSNNDPLSKQLSSFLLTIHGKNESIAKSRDALRVHEILSEIRKIINVDI